MKMPWKHNYHREKVFVKISKMCAEFTHHPELAGKTAKYYYDLRLYDGKRCVLSCGVKSFTDTERDRQVADEVDQHFFEMMGNYVDSHMYFDPKLWWFELRHPVKVVDEM